MNLYLAGCASRPYVIENYIKIYLAGQAPWKETEMYIESMKKMDINILESFYYADDYTEKIIPLCKNFLLDSGAFTFMSNCKNAANINWEEYIERYADFINRNKCDKFFELDIDKIVGYPKVLEFRKKLEKLVNRPVIPVWHRYRGLPEFYKMCDEYKYVAIGGVVSKEIGKQMHKYFSHFISEAHKRNAKIHGLGFTSLTGLSRYHFDSVDSTAWTTGNRFGYIYKFEKDHIVKYSGKHNQRLKDAVKVAINNFNEWAKFANYADTHF